MHMCTYPHREEGRKGQRGDRNEYEVMRHVLGSFPNHPVNYLGMCVGVLS